jgi:hypothetical protein
MAYSEGTIEVELGDVLQPLLGLQGFVAQSTNSNAVAAIASKYWPMHAMNRLIYKMMY